MNRVKFEEEWNNINNIRGEGCKIITFSKGSYLYAWGYMVSEPESTSVELFGERGDACYSIGMVKFKEIKNVW